MSPIASKTPVTYFSARRTSNRPAKLVPIDSFAAKVDQLKMKAIHEPNFTDTSPIAKLTGKQTIIASELYSRKPLSSIEVIPSPLMKPKLLPLAGFQATHDHSNLARPRNLSLIPETHIPLVNEIPAPASKQHNLDLATELMIANHFEFKRPRANSRVLTLD